MPGMTPSGYLVHYTSAPKTRARARSATMRCRCRERTPPRAGSTRRPTAARSPPPRTGTTPGTPPRSNAAPHTASGCARRTRTTCSSAEGPTASSDWGHKALVAGAGTAVGLFAYNAFESRGRTSVRGEPRQPGIARGDGGLPDIRPPHTRGNAGTGLPRAMGLVHLRARGQTEWWLHIPITDDDIEDSGEQFVISLSNPRPANRVQLGSSSPGYGYHVHPLAASMTVTIYNHEADLQRPRGRDRAGRGRPMDGARLWPVLIRNVELRGDGAARDHPRALEARRRLHERPECSRPGVDWRLRALESGADEPRHRARGWRQRARRRLVACLGRAARPSR